MISFEQVLQKCGFRLADHQGFDSYWNHADGHAVAGISEGADRVKYLSVTLDCGVQSNKHDVQVIGMWDNPIKAALELPPKLKAAYNALLQPPR